MGLTTAYIPNAQVHLPELCTTIPQLHMHPKPTLSVSTTSDAMLLSKPQTAFTESRSKCPTLSALSSASQFLCPSLPLNRGSQKPLRLPNIFAKLFPPTKLQRGTGVDHVMSSQPRGLLLGLCTHLWLCGGVLQRLHVEWVLLGDNVMDLRFHCQLSRCLTWTCAPILRGRLVAKKALAGASPGGTKYIH